MTRRKARLSDIATFVARRPVDEPVR